LRLSAGLLQNRDNNESAHVIAKLFKLRDDRRRFSITFGNLLYVPSGCGFFALEHLHRLAGHDGGDRMLVNKLRVTVTAQKHAEIIEGSDNARQLDAVDQENRERNLLLTNGIEEKILKVLRTFRHGAASFFFAGRDTGK
jgi:hypothetical protein